MRTYEESEIVARFSLACIKALDLAPDTRQRATYDDALIDECADVLIMAISCASTIGALNWVEQLAERVEFKVARTRERMSQP